MSIALGADPRPFFSQLAGDLVINPVVGCRYFLPGLRLPSQSKSITTPWPVTNYTAW